MEALGEQIRSAVFRPRLYNDARPFILDGDLALWRPCNINGRLIAWRTNSNHSHAAMCSWAFGVLEHHESLQFRGGQTETLSSQVKLWPGLCDIYRVNGLVVYPAVEAMRRRSGNPYGWNDIRRAALTKLFPWLRKTWYNDFMVTFDQPCDCSCSVADACRRGGCDPVEGAPVWSIDPGQLSRPGFSEYQFTLYWDKLPPALAA